MYKTHLYFLKIYFLNNENCLAILQKPNLLTKAKTKNIIWRYGLTGYFSVCLIQSMSFIILNYFCVLENTQHQNGTGIRTYNTR